MNIDLTEKEAIIIYTRRYEQDHKYQGLWLIITLLIFTAIFFIIDIKFDNNWLSFSGSPILLTGIIKWLLFLRRSNKYALKMIKQG